MCSSDLGAYRSMRNALKSAHLSPDSIDYINAHGTSTPLGDEIELRAVERLMGNRTADLTMSSTKSSIGHLLGAALAAVLREHARRRRAREARRP